MDVSSIFVYTNFYSKSNCGPQRQKFEKMIDNSIFTRLEKKNCKKVFFVAPTQVAVEEGSFCTFSLVILFRPTLYSVYKVDYRGAAAPKNSKGSHYRIVRNLKSFRYSQTIWILTLSPGKESVSVSVVSWLQLHKNYIFTKLI